jgi:hypothetical protein
LSNNINIKIKKNPTVLVNQSGISAVRAISDLTDVDTSGKTDGSLLIYNEEQGLFQASTLLDKQIINGGHF